MARPERFELPILCFEGKSNASGKVQALNRIPKSPIKTWPSRLWLDVAECMRLIRRSLLIDKSFAPGMEGPEEYDPNDQRSRRGCKIAREGPRREKDWCRRERTRHGGDILVARLPAERSGIGGRVGGCVIQIDSINKHVYEGGSRISG